MAREQRRLAAIVAADVVGYSRLMGRDESGTLARLRAHRTDLIDPAIAAHGGRIVKTMGDGLLLEFSSAVDATRCAIEVQTAMAMRNADVPEGERIVFRIGVNLGDIIIDGDDIHGDGVNVAARLEAEAPAGGILLAGAVHDAVSGRVQATFEDLGELALKNIERPVRAFGVTWSPTDWQVAAATRPIIAAPPAVDAPLALPDKPSIAVLPFQNMSGDPEQEYFADGMVEDIITALSRFKSLFVIARNSSFTYKGKAIDIKQVGRELGVRYVLEGSVRKVGNAVRITAQLIESAAGAHLWADKFDGSLDRIFELQDELAATVVAAVAPKIDQAEMERARRKPVENLDAYDCFLRGMAKFYERGVTGWDEALRLFHRAIELDPDYAPPYALATRYYSVRKTTGRVVDKVAEEAEVRRLAARVAAVGQDDALALCWAGHALVFVCGDHDQGKAFVDRGMAINPNLAVCWQTGGSVSMYRGDHETALEQLTRALRLSPVGPDTFHTEQTMAAACLHLARFEECLHWCARTLALMPNAILPLQMSAMAHALAGNLDEGRRIMERALRTWPNMRISTLKDVHPFRRSEDAERWIQGLRLVGIPE